MMASVGAVRSRGVTMLGLLVSLTAVACSEGPQDAREGAEGGPGAVPMPVRPAPPESLGAGGLGDSSGTIVFDRTQDEIESPRRVLHFLMVQEASVAQTRAAFEQVFAAERSAEPGLVALRGIAYRGSLTGGGEGALTAVAWAEWVPPAGWQASLAGASIEANRLVTSFGAPTWAGTPER